MSETCNLCKKEETLVISHVIPAFVSRWLKDSAVTGHIRSLENINRRIQDGTKLKLLCKDCEQLLSKLEKPFSEILFIPMMNGMNNISYGDWLLNFCVSIAWRILTYHTKTSNDLSFFSQDQIAIFDKSLSVWADVLLNKAPHPGDFSQHLIVFDEITDANKLGLPVNINRFIARTIGFDVIRSDTTCMTYAKFGRLVFIGIIQNGDLKWKNTRVKVGSGVIKPCEMGVPQGVLDYFFDQSRRTLETNRTMSPSQMDKIASLVKANPSRLTGSQLSRAMAADAMLFGMDAVFPTPSQES